MSDKPLISDKTILPEITIKALILSVILAIVLGAANIYLALKIGTTISASIPASVLAIGILHLFKKWNILEANLIQTSASAGEAVAAASAFVLPSMMILRIWFHFPYLQILLVVLIGGILGVLFAVPLRRVLLSLPSLPFPEGVAIGNVLKVSAQGDAAFKYLLQGGFIGGLISFLQNGLKAVSSSIHLWVHTRQAVFGISIGFIPESMAAGFICGIRVGVSLLVGVFIGWLVILPLLALHYGVDFTAASGRILSAYDIAMNVWSDHLRFVGVGCMLFAGVWTLLRLIRPVATGLMLSFSGLKAQSREGVGFNRTDRDLAFRWIFWGVLIVSIVFYLFLVWFFMHAQAKFTLGLILISVLVSVIYLLVVGFLLATIASYFCGLVGSSNNPISGLLIIVVLLISFIFLGLFKSFIGSDRTIIIGAVMIITTIIGCIGAIASENIQDLKAGKMVGATPWKQQLMMGVGVISIAIFVAPILELLFQAYGIGGVYPHTGMSPQGMLAAPQAGLMAAVSEGVLTNNLQWGPILLGVGVAVFVTIIDEILRIKNKRLPALAVGLGIYLPPELMTPFIFGSFVNYLVNKNNTKSMSHMSETEKKDHHEQHNGVLLACGLVAGSALMGVILAIPFVIKGSSDALKIVPAGFLPIAEILGALVTLGLCIWLYKVGSVKGLAKK
jgi:putative OPT family oligopeptide transporter